MSNALWAPGKRVYVAGPYSAPTVEDRAENVWSACDTARAVMRMGYTPFVPHTSHYIDPSNDAFPYERWMEWCLDWLGSCDILLVTGLSKGVRIEIDFAVKNAIPIVWSLAQLEWRHEQEQHRTGVCEREAEPTGQEGWINGRTLFKPCDQTIEDEAAAAPAEEEEAPVKRPTVPGSSEWYPGRYYGSPRFA